MRQLLDNPSAASRPFSRWSFRFSEDDPSFDLTEEQSKLLDAVWKYPKPRVTDEYPGDRARRWVFRRTLSLGWTPELFGKEDRTRGYRDSGRSEHKAERWGKKYQWMAYHELLARVADNFQASRRYSDYQPYEGLYQITGEREIDPSLPPVDYRTLVDRNGEGPTWGASPVKFDVWPPGALDFRRYRADIDSFLLDVDSEPNLVNILLVQDSLDESWILLDAYLEQSDPNDGMGCNKFSLWTAGSFEEISLPSCWRRLLNSERDPTTLFIRTDTPIAAMRQKSGEHQTPAITVARTGRLSRMTVAAGTSCPPRKHTHGKGIFSIARLVSPSTPTYPLRSFKGVRT